MLFSQTTRFKDIRRRNYLNSYNLVRLPVSKIEVDAGIFKLNVIVRLLVSKIEVVVGGTF